jgi:hypothetical protein
MIIDDRLEVSDSQAVTATAVSTDIIDLGPVTNNTLRDVGNGRQLFLVIQCDTTTAAVGAATVTFSLESDSTTDLATSPTVHATSAAIGKATLVAGYQLVIPVPAGLKNFERYMGVRYTVATGPLTAGAFSAFITDAPQIAPTYADAI